MSTNAHWRWQPHSRHVLPGPPLAASLWTRSVGDDRRSDREMIGDSTGVDRKFDRSRSDIRPCGDIGRFEWRGWEMLPNIPGVSAAGERIFDRTAPAFDSAAVRRHRVLGVQRVLWPRCFQKANLLLVVALMKARPFCRRLDGRDLPSPSADPRRICGAAPPSWLLKQQSRRLRVGRLQPATVPTCTCPTNGHWPRPGLGDGWWVACGCQRSADFVSGGGGGE